MKRIVWSLVVVNLLLAGYFATAQLWLEAPPERTASLNVDRLSLRTEPETSPRRMPPTRSEAETLCVEWRGLNPTEFVEVRERLKALAGERVMSFAEMPLETRHWVLFPPLPSPESAAAKLDELVATGLEDAFVVKDGVWRNAISLGLFATHEAASRRVLEVAKKGVLGTHIEVLPRHGTDYYFVIRSEDPEALKSLSGIKQAYPNSQQSRIACPA
jgi:hypothetical protein